MANTSRLNERELKFCSDYARLGNEEEALLRAGYSKEQAQSDFTSLLANKWVRREIQRCREVQRKELGALALAGLRRVAFGGIGDAVRLMVEEDLPPHRLEQLDLFAVSEIRRPRSGGWEIKFHDRLKALALLLEHSADSDSDDRLELLEALDKGAAAISKSGSDPRE